MNNLNKDIRECYKCKDLVESRRMPVLGYGSGENGVMIVGEAPSQSGANITGIPFSSRYSGLLLREIIEEAGLLFSECYVTNVCKCSPDRNRTPTREEVNNCKKYLEMEINIVKPKLILLVGKTAREAVTRPNVSHIHHPGFAIRKGQTYIEKYKDESVNKIKEVLKCQTTMSTWMK